MKLLEKLRLFFLPCQGNNYLPFFLKPKFLNSYFLVLLLLKVLTLPLLYLSFKSSFFAQISQDHLFQLINEERIKRGLVPFTENPLLKKSSYLKAKDILENEYFAHYNPQGVSFWEWFKISGYNFKLAGENLALGFLDTKEVHEALMNSISHRKNILNPNFKEIGISVLKGEFQGNEVYVVVEHFGAPKKIGTSQKIAFSPPTSAKPLNEIFVEKEIPLQVSGTTFSKFLRKAQHKTVEFIVKKYTLLLNFVIYLTLIFLIFSLLITIWCDIFIYRRFIIDYKYLIPKTIIFSSMLIFFIYLDQSKLIQLIPHKLLIHGA